MVDLRGIGHSCLSWKLEEKFLWSNEREKVSFCFWEDRKGFWPIITLRWFLKFLMYEFERGKTVHLSPQRKEDHDSGNRGKDLVTGKKHEY